MSKQKNGSNDIVASLAYGPDGLIPAIVQEHVTGDVLMMAYMNADSLRMTLEKGCTHFWSRSRKKFWMKGESSGHVQVVKSISYDCDKDTLLIRVDQKGPGACHTGHRSCFFMSIDGTETSGAAFSTDEAYKNQPFIERLADIIHDRRTRPQSGSYVSSLMGQGRTAILKKVGEEATEAVVAAAQGDRKAVIHEVSDLLFHTLILLEDQGVALGEIMNELRTRHEKRKEETA